MPSERSRAYYTKMEIDDFCKLIEYFSFNKVSLEGSSNINPTSYSIAIGIAKILPYIRSTTVKYDYLEKADMHLGALRVDSCKELVASDWTAIQKYNFVWNTLNSVVVTYEEENEDAIEIFREMITRWNCSQTTLKHFSSENYYGDVFNLDSIGNLRPFMNLPDGTTFTMPMEIRYMMVEDNGHFRYAIISVRAVHTYSFYDITDCDGCQCQTEFCFKKLIEALTDKFEASEGIDWSMTIDQWNFGLMEDLGKLLEEKLICRNRDTCHCRPNCYGPILMKNREKKKLK